MLSDGGFGSKDNEDSDGGARTAEKGSVGDRCRDGVSWCDEVGRTEEGDIPVMYRGRSEGRRRDVDRQTGICRRSRQ